MKNINYLLISGILFLGCNGNKDKADAYGNFEAVEIIMGAEAQGKLIQLNVEDGMVLKAGEKVGFVDTTALFLKKEQLLAMKKSAAAKLTQVNAQVLVQETQKETALVEQKRIQNLMKDKAVPEKQQDEINGQLNVLNSQINATKTQTQSIVAEMESVDQQILQIQDQINKSYIINPVPGTVLEKYVEPSEIVTLSKNLYKIADLKTLRLKVYVTGAQLPQIKIGQKVTVKIDEDASNNQSLEGTISWISSQAEFTPKIIQTKDERVKQVYAVKVDVVNDGRIKIGMPGEVFLNPVAIK